MKSTKLTIGSTPLRPGRINRDFLESAEKSIDGSKVRKGKKAVLETLDQWTPQSPISVDDYRLFQDYASSVEQRYKEHENEWWTLEKNDDDTTSEQASLKKKMAIEGKVLLHSEKLQTELREASARAAVQALAGTLAGAPGVVAAYSAYANGPEWTNPETENTKAVLTGVDSLLSGESDMITHGNAVEQVHRAELWKTMNSLLDESIKKAKSGRPVEVDLQFYELTSPDFIKKVAESARAGNKVRLNVDAGRLAFPSKDKEGDSYFSLDATPDKIRSILQLAQLKKADVGVSFYPQKKMLGSSSDLMHRKIVRVGNKVLISGMNANLGSGENLDSGYVVRGKAAARLTKNLARDIQDSKESTLDDIWGSHHIEKYRNTNLRLGSRGVIALLDSISGPSPAGTELPDVESVEQLESMAKKAGVKLREIFELSPEDYEPSISKMLTGRFEVQLTNKGKELLQATIERALEVASTPKNLSRLDDMELPSTRKVGDARVDIADSPVEREALVIAAIAQAQEFIFLPGFVITRAVAAALAARKAQVTEQGRDLDVRVIADASLYPHGGTPNSYGIKMLEDHGIQPRWSKLERSGDHDRKIHAKQMLTDRGEITGSTNFSNRGLRENWETSAYIHFNKKDEKSLASQAQSKAQFIELWNNSLELNTVEHSALLNRDVKGPGKEWFIEQSRDRSITHTLRLIGNYERETGKIHQELLATNPEIRELKESYEKQGYSYGDSVLRAAEKVLGKDTYRALFDDLKTAKTLKRLQSRVQAFHSGLNPSPDAEESEAPQELLFA